MTDALHRYQSLKKAIPPVFVLWTLLMLALTLLPANTIPESSLFSYDKVGHFGMFGGWTFFLGLYLIVYRERTETSLLLLLIAGVLFGGIIEILQHYIPGNRTASWGDFIANSLGAITACLVLLPLKRYLRRQ
ncbi:VanZ family protein [Balneolales bacterium ANBcel1]|nr:VanZ family protein [Balneolales bacterium ANBcel1]